MRAPFRFSKDSDRFAEEEANYVPFTRFKNYLAAPLVARWGIPPVIRDSARVS